VQVIGVIDLFGGQAVHARRGVRENYEPVRAIAGTPIEPGDAQALARAYVDRLGIRELYVADLDSILSRLRPRQDSSAGDAPQDALLAGIAGLGVPLWVDSGVSSVDQARRTVGLGITRVVVGLETLTSYEALETICDAVGGQGVAFSLDLRDGEPIRMNDGVGGEPAEAIAARAADAGVGTLIVIDLARVGMGGGLDLALISRVRKAAPAQVLLAGGGVRGADDLAQLAGAGCDGALVATALHSGQLTAADVARACSVRA
jgi:phosphoribosylformimino-5-aminoimidazole carboxamide ribotide isomerase